MLAGSCQGKGKKVHVWRAILEHVGGKNTKKADMSSFFLLSDPILAHRRTCQPHNIVHIP